MWNQKTPVAPTVKDLRGIAAGLYCRPQRRTYLFDDFQGEAGPLWLLTIGRSADCDIRVADRRVADIHALLSRQGDGSMKLRNVPGESVYVDDEPMGERVVLREGMCVRLGRTRFIGVNPHGRIPLRTHSMAELGREGAVAYGSLRAAADRLGQSREFVRRQRGRAENAVTSEQRGGFADGLYCSRDERIVRFGELRLFTIGRARTADIQIADMNMSRVHALLVRREDADGAMMIRDCDSVNGVMIDGEYMIEPTAITVGMRIRLGDTVFTGIGDDGSVPITADTFSELGRRAAAIYGTDQVAAEQIGHGREFVRKRRCRNWRRNPGRTEQKKARK